MPMQQTSSDATQRRDLSADAVSQVRILSWTQHGAGAAVLILRAELPAAFGHDRARGPVVEITRHQRGHVEVEADRLATEGGAGEELDAREAVAFVGTAI